MKPTITAYEDISLITLQNIPADIAFIADVFKNIAELGVDVDMISVSPVQSSKTSVSFTISDDDLITTLSYTSKLEDGTVKSIVSSGNRKISIDDESMVNCPGVAAKILGAIAASKADIRLITTSESQISVLVTMADFDAAFAALDKAEY